MNGTTEDTAYNGATNMIPQFCKTYYYLTGHKVIAVMCAKGGEPIEAFTPNGGNGRKIYQVMKQKYNAAVSYAQSQNLTIANKYFVAFQGEANVNAGERGTASYYTSKFKEITTGLKSDCGITKGAIVETGSEIYTNTMAAVNAIHQAQESLIDNTNIILGSDYPYQSYVPMDSDYNNCTTNVCYNTSGQKLDYGTAYAKATERVDSYYFDGKEPLQDTNKIHFTSAALSQIGLETAEHMATKLTGRISGIELSSVGKTSYRQNTENFDVSGWKIKVNYSKGTSITLDVTSDMIYHFNNTTVGTNQIMIYYHDKAVYYNLSITGTLNVSAEGYNGNYDGNSHGISVSCSGATIKYGTQSGTYNLTSSPTYTDAGTYTVYYQVSKTGYETVTGSKTIKINKISGEVTLSATNGTLIYPNVGTFTVTKNTGAGALSVTSSDTNVATASISGTKVTVSPGTKAGTATITVKSAATTNYNEATATYIVTVVKEEKEYTLTVNPNGGKWNNFTSNGEVSQKKGTTKDLGQATAPAGYEVTFNTNGGNAVSKITSTKAFDKWTLQTGAKGSLNGTTYTFGEGNDTVTANYKNIAITLPSTTKNGYTFEGWYTDSNLTSKAGNSNASYTVTKATTLYAKWTPVSYTITYNLDGGSVNSNPTTYTIETNDITLNNPTKTGYTFKGWTGSNGTTAQTTVKIAKGSTGNKTYTANWEEIREISDVITSKEYTVNEEKLTVSRIKPSVTVADLKKQINNEMEYSIKDKKNNILKNTDKVGTGYKIVMADGKEYKISVLGDLNGDAKISIIDIARLQKISAGIITASELEKLAGDFNQDNRISIIDLAKMQKLAVGQDIFK